MTQPDKNPLVIVDLYSGVPNPKRELRPAEAAEFLKRLSHLPVREQSPNYLEPNAWYGGMLVRLTDTRVITIHEEHVFDSTSNTILLDQGRALEQWLYALIPAEVFERAGILSFPDLIVAQNEQPLEGVTGGAEPACPGAPTPPTAKNQWNVLPGKLDNNCYNYANNEFSNVEFALPGRVFRSSYTESEMDTLLQNDGLLSIGKTMLGVCLTRPGTHLIAVGLRRQDGTKTVGGVKVPNYRDFHCVRLDSGGVWSHKDGAKKAKDTDNTNKRLDDIAKAFFKPKLHLVGFYWSIKGSRNINHP